MSIQKQDGKAEIEITERAPFILISSVLNKPGVGATICEALASHDINIESFVVVSVPGKERTDILLEVSRNAVEEANHLLSEITSEVAATGLLSPGINVEKLTKMIIRTPGVRQQPGMGAKMLRIFQKYDVNVWALIVTGIGNRSEIKALIESRSLADHPEIVPEIMAVL
jgi:acetolactate synthase small subunit